MQLQQLKQITQHYHLNENGILAEKMPFSEIPCALLYGQALTFTQVTDFAHNFSARVLGAFIEGDYLAVILQADFPLNARLVANEMSLDFAFLNYQAQLSQKGLLLMDMDSTMIQMECIDEIAKLAGTGEEVSAITASAMRGELDFEQSLRRRVGTLKNAPESILQQVRAHLPLMPGLEKMLKTLQQYGWKIAIASGGFDYFADFLKEKLQLDFAVANQFQIENGRLTGNLFGAIVDSQFKAQTLQALQEKWQIPATQTVAIGDGANDLPMLALANLGAAFHAKPKVQQKAQVVVNFADLSALVCLLRATEKLQQYQQ